jgi:hypothetical protein
VNGAAAIRSCFPPKTAGLGGQKMNTRQSRRQHLDSPARSFPCPQFACLEKRRSRLAWLVRRTAAGGGERFGHVASRSARCEMDSTGTPLQVPFRVSIRSKSRPAPRRDALRTLQVTALPFPISQARSFCRGWEISRKNRIQCLSPAQPRDEYKP